MGGGRQTDRDRQTETEDRQTQTRENKSERPTQYKVGWGEGGVCGGRGAGGERGGKTEKLSSFVTFCQGDAAYYSCETGDVEDATSPLFTLIMVRKTLTPVASQIVSLQNNAGVF